MLITQLDSEAAYSRRIVQPSLAAAGTAAMITDKISRCQFNFWDLDEDQVEEYKSDVLGPSDAQGHQPFSQIFKAHLTQALETFTTAPDTTPIVVTAHPDFLCRLTFRGEHCQIPGSEDGTIIRNLSQAVPQTFTRNMSLSLVDGIPAVHTDLNTLKSTMRYFTALGLDIRETLSSSSPPDNIRQCLEYFEWAYARHQSS